MSIPNWMPIAQSYMGLKEISGKGSNKTIDGWFEEFGYPQFKDDTAWCSLFVMKVMKDAGYTGSTSLAARSWLKWGKSIRNPSYGCIVVFKRGNSTWQGHVAFYVKEDDKYVWVLGGNQRNSVNVSKYRKSDVLGYRVPVTPGNSRTVAAVATTAVATGGSEVLDAVGKTQETLLGISIPTIQYAAAALAIVSLCVILYARWDDAKTKGR